MESRVILVTPELAARWLEQNTHNRHIYKSVVDSYARDMKMGMWVVNNQGIGFDDDGMLLDGQHRLLAVIQSGTPTKILVIFGIDKDGEHGLPAQATIDRGKQRGIGDVLSLAFGITHANIQAAIARAIIEMCTTTTGKAMSAGTIWEARKVYEDEICLVIQHIKGGKQLRYSPVLACIAFAAKISKDVAGAFAEKYFTGIGLKADDPAYVLRNYMINRDANYAGSGEYRKVIRKYALQALMHYFKGSSLRKLSLSNNGVDYFMSRQAHSVREIKRIMISIR
jgi:hypothetical protein